VTDTDAAGGRRPDLPQPTPGPADRRSRLTGVGVGPGDAGLLTRRALEVLAEADRVVAPTTAPEVCGRAEAVVRQALPDLPMTRLPFDMTPDSEGGGEAARQASHLAAARALLPWLAAGEHVAFITLGDPNVYSTFPSLLRAVRALGGEPEVDTVPGITAFQALAAKSGTVLLDGTDSLVLVTALDGPAHVAAALAEPGQAVVVYKGGRHVPAIARLLEERGRLAGAVLGELLGLEGERVLPLAVTADRPAGYLATVIVPPARAGSGAGAAAGESGAAAGEDHR
jgi:precorrin-2/cobalt-factor-2 C20-methyltransferase